MLTALLGLKPKKDIFSEKTVKMVKGFRLYFCETEIRRLFILYHYGLCWDSPNECTREWKSRSAANGRGLCRNRLLKQTPKNNRKTFQYLTPLRPILSARV